MDNDIPSPAPGPPDIFIWPTGIFGDDVLDGVFGREFPPIGDSGAGDLNLGGSAGGIITVGGNGITIAEGGAASEAE